LVDLFFSNTLAIISIASCIYHILAAVCAVVFYYRRKPLPKREEHYPKVACLKPLCGYDFETCLNLESFIYQDYPGYEVVFGTAYKDDSAYPIATSICQKSDTSHAKVVFGEIGQGTNRKVRNLRNIEANVSPDVEFLVISDSDTRVTQDYLKEIIFPMRSNPQVGVVTCLYKIENTPGLGGLMEALLVESTFAPGVLVATTFSPLKYAFGASIAVRRSDFFKAGGFAAIENYLADDYQIGHIVFAQGKRVVLSSYVVSLILPKQSAKGAISHLVRWNRTIRTCNRVGYFFSMITHCTVWATLAFLASGMTPLGWGILGSVSFLRFVTAAIIAACLTSKSGILRAMLAPLWDFLAFLLWFLGLWGNKVRWRGVTYQIFPDGQVVEIDRIQ
jgi:ceramide glucosyltransferase